MRVVQLRVLGGAIADVAPDATAYDPQNLFRVNHNVAPRVS